jgi:L-cysteine S-thiosulfotransferase
MRRLIFAIAGLAFFAGFPPAGWATPEEDLKSMREFYMKRFPGVPLDEFKNGVYAIDADARLSWESREEFPPYEEQLKRGALLFATPFANGKTYADCFRNGGIGIRQNYPYFDAATGEVKTLEQEIGECRQKNGEPTIDPDKGDMAAISAHMASTSNGKVMDVKIPDDARALAWYEKGKQMFYQRFGQLNMSCANCHIDHVGKRMRAPILPPALGQPNRFPIYIGIWGDLGTLHRRYAQCLVSIRAKPFPSQSPEYRALEYYQTYLGNGITVRAPGHSR